MKTYSLAVFSAAVIIFCIFSQSSLCASVSADTAAVAPDPLKKRIVGKWQMNGFFYDFSDAGTVRIISVKENVKGEKVLTYSIFRIGDFPFIKIEDKKAPSYLFIDDITDSTATFAPATIFVRADSGNDIIGTWKNVKNFRTYYMIFDTRNFTYRETFFNTTTEQTTVEEERSGTYTFSSPPKKGRLSLFFGDGKMTMVFPLVFKELLYIFDLNPRKSAFIKVREVHSPEKLQTSVTDSLSLLKTN